MRFICERCGKKYHSADEPAPGHVYRLRCKVCGHPIVVTAPAPGMASTAPPPAITPPRLDDPFGAAEEAGFAGRRAKAKPEQTTRSSPLPLSTPLPRPASPVPGGDFDPFAEVPDLSGTQPDGARSLEPVGSPRTPVWGSLPASALKPEAVHPLATAEPDPFAAWHAVQAQPGAPETPRVTPGPVFSTPRPFPIPEGLTEDLEFAVTVEEQLARKLPDADKTRAGAKRNLVPLLAAGLALAAATGAAVVFLPQFLEQKPTVPIVRTGERTQPTTNATPTPTPTPTPPQAATAPAPAPATPPAAPASAPSSAGSAPPPLVPPALAPREIATREPRAAAASGEPGAKPEPVHSRGKVRKARVAPEPAASEEPAAAPKQARADQKTSPLDLQKAKEDVTAPAPTPAPAPARAPPPAPSLPAPRPEEVTGLTPQRVASALASQRRVFDTCINEAIAKDPKFPFAGRKVGLYLTVNPSGSVSSPFLDDPDVDDSPLGACLKVAGQRTAFPSFQGEAFQVRVPLAIRKVE